VIHQSGAVLAQRPSPTPRPITPQDREHSPKNRDSTVLSFAETHSNPLYLNGNFLHYLILKPLHLRLSDPRSDSIVLCKNRCTLIENWSIVGLLQIRT
jgi:hypothetical protein